MDTQADGRLPFHGKTENNALARLNKKKLPEIHAAANMLAWSPGRRFYNMLVNFGGLRLRLRLRLRVGGQEREKTEMRPQNPVSNGLISPFVFFVYFFFSTEDKEDNKDDWNWTCDSHSSTYDLFVGKIVEMLRFPI